jgi:hypothetical protein
MSVTRAARRRGASGLAGRSFAAVLLAALLLSFLAPAALVMADEDGARCCRGGRCCCAGAPSDTACVRAACRCGDDSRVPVLPGSASDDALLPAAPLLQQPRGAGLWYPPVAVWARAGALVVLAPPPWYALSSIAFVRAV